jgi:hypothetical protein
MLLAGSILHNRRTPEIGQTVVDGSLFAEKWMVGWSELTGNPAMLLQVAGDMSLTFEFAAPVALELGASLVAEVTKGMPAITKN